MPKFLRLTFVVLLLSPTLVAQTKTNCQERTVVASVVDKRGLPIRDLVADNFRASYQGRPATVVSYLRDDSKSRVYLLLDASGSMGEGDYKWKIATRAASEFVSTAPRPTLITFLSFGTEVNQRFDSSGGRQPVLNWLANAQVHKNDPRGHTALYGSVMAAIKDLEPARPGDSIYVITDGGENASKEKSSQIARALRDSGVRLFVFLLPSVHRFDSDVTMGAHELLSLVPESGGELISLAARAVHADIGRYDYDDNVVAAIRTATAMIETHINDFYVLNLRLPEVVGTAKLDWKLTVAGSQLRKRNDLTLAYPHRFAACSQEQAANPIY